MTVSNLPNAAGLQHLIAQLQTESNQGQAEEVKEKIKAWGVQVDAFIKTRPSLQLGAVRLDAGLAAGEAAAPMVPPGLIFDPDATVPPDVAPALEALLLSQDADGNAKLSVSELKAYLISVGMPEAEADRSALMIFANIGQTEIGMADLELVQQATTELWLAANVTDPGEFVADLVAKYGEEKGWFGRRHELDREGLIAGLVEDGWSEAAATSLADKLGLEPGEKLRARERGGWFGHGGGLRLYGREAVRNLKEICRDSSLQETLQGMEQASLFTRQDPTTTNVPPGLIFDFSQPVPPDVGPALAKLLQTYDADGSSGINADEIKAYLLQEGVPEETAQKTVDALFAVIGDDELQLEDLPKIQDAITQMWIAQNVQDPQAFLEDLVARYGEGRSHGFFGFAGRKELNPDNLVEGLMADGWSREAAESLSKTIFPQGHGRIRDGHFWDHGLFKAARNLEQVIKNPEIQEAASAITLSSMFVRPADALGPNGGLVFDPYGPYPPDVGPALAQLLETHDADGNAALSERELATYLMDAGLTPVDAGATAALYFTALGESELTLDNLDQLQEGLVKIWLAHNVHDSQGFIESLIDQFGEAKNGPWGGWFNSKTLDRDALVSGLTGMGWSPRAAEGLAEVIFAGRDELTAGQWQSHFQVAQAASALDSIIGDPLLQRAGEELAEASLLTNVEVNGPATGLLFNVYQPFPPDVGPALAHVIKTHDADGDGAINAAELEQYMLDNTIPPAAAETMTRKIFELAGSEQLTLDNLDTIQDGLNQLWLSVRVVDGEAFVEDLVNAYGKTEGAFWGKRTTLDRESLIAGLTADGWNRRAALALADVLFTNDRKEISVGHWGMGKQELKGASAAIDALIQEAQAA